MQLHYLALFLGFIISLYVLSTFLIRYFIESSKNILILIKNYSSILFGFIIGLFPFLVFEARHGFPNIKSIIKFIFYSGDAGLVNNFLGNISNVFFRLFSRLVTAFPPPEQVAINQHLNTYIWYYLSLILGIISFLVLIFQYKETIPKTKELFESKYPAFLKLNLLIMWFVFGILLFGFYKKSIYDYYFGFMFPLPFILVGNTLDFFMRKTSLLRIVSVADFL